MWAGSGVGCARCGRLVTSVPECGEVVCTGCLTVREDIEETQHLIALLKRRRWDQAAVGRDRPEATRRLIARVLENLDERRFGPAQGLTPRGDHRERLCAEMPDLPANWDDQPRLATS
jgi:hypothetical protein